MAYVVLVLWVVQIAAGGWLLRRWLVAGGRGSGRGIVHGVVALAALAAWIVFLATGVVWWAWAAFAVVTVVNVLGDAMLIARERARSGVRAGFWRDYGAAIGAVFRGRTPGLVAFHALFAGVVFFSCLGVCIGATVAA